MSVAAPFPLLGARPPYDGFARAPRDRFRLRAPGQVIALLLTENADVRVLRRTVRRLGRAAPATALVAVYDRRFSDPARVGRLAAAAGLGTVPLDTPPLEPALRAALATLDGLAGGLRRWLRVQDAALDPRLLAAIHRGAHRAVRHGELLWSGGGSALRTRWPDVPDLARFAGLTPRGLRDLCARDGLPSPVQWKILLRDLVQAILVQRAREVPLVRSALLVGRPDSQALSHAFHGSFGTTPSRIRDHLGWQWLAFHWLERHGLGRNRHPAAGSDHARRAVPPYPGSAAVTRRERGARDRRHRSPSS